MWMEKSAHGVEGYVPGQACGYPIPATQILESDIDSQYPVTHEPSRDALVSSLLTTQPH